MYGEVNLTLQEKENVKLKEENARLKRDNELLVSAVVQLKATINRLINRYVVDGEGEGTL